ncbi:MAG TPA: hypothetical protein VHE35_15705, partial [Kofleriaceae bacterium]|nr:hypothetical protein [Kofleriaceae bacterium]
AAAAATATDADADEPSIELTAELPDGKDADIDVELSARLARGTSKPNEPPPELPLAMPVGDDPPAPRRQLAAGSSPSIDRIQLALRGDRDDRMAIMRDRNRTAQIYVLRNPGLTFDEVCAIARMPSVAPDVLVQLAERREWGHRPEVAMALVRNPATPVPVAIKLVDFVSLTDLRLLAKDARTREPVQRAARRKLLC